MQISSVSGNPYLQQLQQSLFQKADSNADGSLSIDEFMASSSASSTGSASSAGPASSTGTASSADKTKQAQALFKSIDANGDGKVTGDELGSFFTKLSSNTQSSLLQLQQQGGTDRATNFLAKADTDGDGSLTLDEFTAAGPKGATADKSKELFGEMDTDGDGKVTKDELTTFDQSHAPSGATAQTTAKSGHAHHGGHMPPPADSDDDDDGTSLADILAGTSTSSSSASATDPLADLLSGNSTSGNSGTGSLADVLAKMSDAANATGTDDTTDFGKQISGYLQQMLSGYADQAKNGSATSSISVTA